MKAVPLSECGLWALQENYYRNLGVQAWNERTPYYVTNSVVMAEAYADLILNFLLDRPLDDPSEPLTILELGTGTGRLAHYLAGELTRKLAYFPATRGVRFRIVMTDLSEETLAFWASHKRLRPEVDFALFRADSDPVLQLRRAGVTLERLANPLVVLANYFFDSLAQDEFRVTNGLLEEALVTLEPLVKPPRDARDVRVLRSYKRVDPGRRYRDPDLTRLLSAYGQGSFTLPVAGLGCLKNLRKLGKLMLLSSDRGFTCDAHMTHYTEHRHELHEGAFSNLVNYGAICSTFQSSWMTSHMYLDSVQTVCALDFEGEFGHLGYAFGEHIERANLINTCNEMFALARGKEEFYKTALPGFVRLNMMDPQAFSAAANRIAGFIPRMNYSECQDLIAMIEQVWEQDYHFPGSPNVTFWLAHLCYGLGRYERAMEFFDITMQRTGVDEVLLYLKGQCYEALGRREEARACYQRSLEVNPGFEEALAALREDRAAGPGTR